jgi:hypothetical protein
MCFKIKIAFHRYTPYKHIPWYLKVIQSLLMVVLSLSFGRNILHSFCAFGNLLKVKLTAGTLVSMF